MAGFIFSISGSDALEGVKECIRKGCYAAQVPQDLESSKSKQVIASVLADYLSMVEGDNVYFLSKRKIYGIGKLVSLAPGTSCCIKNYPSACVFETQPVVPEGEIPVVEDSTQYRWACFFRPDNEFFSQGVDMDDALTYKPSAFKMLRAFQDRSFIKIDDEENQALKEYIYLSNQNNNAYFQFEQTEHARIALTDLTSYLIQSKETTVNLHDPVTFEAGFEMLVEAAVIEELKKPTGCFGNWDYITHQVIASPFKPLAYIDKIDVFAYRFLGTFPGAQKPVEKYLIIELKKGKGNRGTALQTMRYVDWVCKEYTAGDYSRIEAKVIARSYTRNINQHHDEDCTRHFIVKTHPVVSQRWDSLSFFTYRVEENGDIVFTEQ